MKKIILMIFLSFFIPMKSWGIPMVTVSIEPSASIVDVGDIFSVDIVADIADPVIGWGLDITYDPTVISQEGMPVIGPNWIASSALDGDGLAGLYFNPIPPPYGVFGDNILLATLTFRFLTANMAEISASATTSDLTEGFPLAFPAIPGSFASVAYEAGTVAPVPEPATILLLASGIAGLGVFGRKKFRKK